MRGKMQNFDETHIIELSNSSTSSVFNDTTEESNEEKLKWFQKGLGLTSENGSITRQQFMFGVRKVEDFSANLFSYFDTHGRGFLSVQELLGGLSLLLEQRRSKRNENILKWFNEYFKILCGSEFCISQENFVSNLAGNDTFAGQLFAVFDLDGNGEIHMNEFIASLDRLKCASVDSKWYRWIEDHFNITGTDQRKITFNQFLKTLHLKKSFFSERFFAMFDKDGDGSISMHELINSLQILTRGTEHEKLKFIFDVYDIDGDGSLNMDEVKVVFASCIEESHIKFSVDQMQELVEVFVQETDVDHNEQITFQEFSSFLSKFPGVAENLTITAANWLNPASPQPRNSGFTNYVKSVRPLDYIRKNPQKVFFVALYFLLNAALFVWVAITRKDEGGWVIVARTHGMCLNFNCVFVLVLMMKSSLTWLRSTRFGKYLPIDDHIQFHKYVGVVICVLSVAHSVGHLGRYVVTDSPIKTWEYLFTTKAGEGWVDGTAGITGVLLLTLFGVMSVMSLPVVRRKGYFELFYFTHHLFIVVWIVLILHAPNFWKWFIAPALVYFIERMLRLKVVNTARFGKTYIKEGIVLPSNVIHLIIPRSQNFNYRPGDYVLVNIPQIAKYEWHPFTISSSPDQSDTIWLHVRVAGTWTNKLYNYFYEEQKIKELYTRKQTKRKTLLDLWEEESKVNELRLRARDIYNPIMHTSWTGSDDSNNNNMRNNRTNGPNSLIKYCLENECGLFNEAVSYENYQDYNRKDLDARLQICIDGPYGSPSQNFFEAEHAVLISSGIGVTPFASILQTIMLRYKSVSHTCPNCTHCWVGQIPFSLKKLQKVDFFWINRDQESFEWFLSLLSQLEIEQSEQRGVFNEHFLDMHIYMTSALKKEDMKALGLQLALELIHQKKDKDLITGLKTRTKPGRPDWDEVFKDIKAKNRGKVTVFYCGNTALEKILQHHCHKYQFNFRSEKF